MIFGLITLALLIVLSVGINVTRFNQLEEKVGELLMKRRIEDASLNALLDIATSAQAQVTAAKAAESAAEAADETDKASLDAANKAQADLQTANTDLQSKLDAATATLSGEADLTDDQSAKITALTAPAPAPAATSTTSTDTTTQPTPTTDGPAVVPAES
jgi:biopolymer transport protein ExbB/TolQ